MRFLRTHAAAAIVVLVFGILGAAFLAVGLGLTYALRPVFDAGGLPRFFPLIFVGLGAAFFAVAVIVLLCLALTERRRRAVRARGRIVSAEVTAVRPNPAISVNGRNPSVVECVYRADDGASYLLKSDALWWDAAAKIAVGDAVPVYWDDYDKKHYSVDLSGFCAESPVDLR